MSSKAEFWAPHTFAFAGAVLLTVVAAYLAKHGLSRLGAADEALIVSTLVLLWTLAEGALYSLGCAWGGVSRPRKAAWAFACGVAFAAGLMLYAELDRPAGPPTTLEEAKQEYTRGALGVAYAFLAPVLAGLVCGWITRRAPNA